MASVGSALKLLALGPNPALQRVLRFDELSLGEVNRAVGQSTYVGGKGQGVALAAHRWSPGCSVVAHFLGGDEGLNFIANALDSAGVAQVTQPTAGATRTCTTLLSQGTGTEIIGPSEAVSEADVDGLLDRIDDTLRAGGIGGVALCGTVPPGAASLYGSMADRLLQSGEDDVILLLDGHKHVETVLDSGRVDVLKLNVDEVKALTSAADADAAAAMLLAPDRQMRRSRSLVALTDGPEPALLYSASGASWRLHVPSIECVNAIGAGDVCTAVFLRELYTSRVLPTAGEDSDAEAFAWGLAAACARCTHEQPVFEREEVVAMKAQIRIERR